MDFKQNYFELFGLGESFELDASVLTIRYRDLQKALHPDRFANATDQERRISLQQAAQINTGFETLKDPLSRARYMLSLRGVEESGHATISDVEFLEEQMELRELLVEVREESDPMSALLAFMAKLESKHKQYVNALTKAFGDDVDMDVEQAKMLVQRMQFVQRLMQEAEALEEELL